MNKKCIFCILPLFYRISPEWARGFLITSEVSDMKQLFCLSHIPWQARPNRTQQLLARLNDVQILFFEPPVSRSTNKPKQGRKMRPHITVYTLPAPLLPRWKNPTIQRRNNRKTVDFIQQILIHHHFVEPVLWCTCPEQAIYLDHFAYSGLVYDCFRAWGNEYLGEERDLTRHAEVVFAASPGLVQRLSPCNDNIVLLPNGVNDHMFTRPGLTPPIQLSKLSAPILGRVGDINSRIELPPLLQAAQAHPEWTFLLMGRVTSAVRAQLKHHPNILLTGPVNPVELPDYLYACDVLFDLFHRDFKGSDVIPSRMYEYLASGKPVVAMIEPQQAEPFPDVVYPAYDCAGFVRRCQEALEEKSSLVAPRRQDYARQASWSGRAQVVTEILQHTGLF